MTPKPAKQFEGLALQKFLSWGVQHSRGSSTSFTDQFHSLPFPVADGEVATATPKGSSVRAASWDPSQPRSALGMVQGKENNSQPQRQQRHC